jgi:signal transduction histidine kinase
MLQKSQREIPTISHQVQLYEEGAFPSPAILDFLINGLAEKKAAIIVATATNYAHLQRSFDERGQSLQASIDLGSVAVKEAGDLLKSVWRDDAVDVDLFEKQLGPDISRLLEGHQGVVVYTEMVDLLLHDGKIKQMLALESIWDRFIAGRPVQLFFGYHIDWFKPEYGLELMDQIIGAKNVLAPIQLNANTPAQYAAWIDFIHARKVRFRKELADLTTLEEGMARDLRSLNALNRGVIQKYDEQDRWIAHYLSDELAENLTALQLSLASLPMILKDVPEKNSAELKAKLEELNNFVKQMTDSVRETVDKIHAPLLEDFGLAAALRTFILSTRNFSKAKIKLTVTPPDEFRLKPEVEQHLIEVVREAITNAIKHTQATKIDVDLTIKDGKLTARIADDGLGFDSAKVTEGLGLPMMRQRCALLNCELKIISKPNGGTVVEFTIDL